MALSHPARWHKTRCSSGRVTPWLRSRRLAASNTLRLMFPRRFSAIACLLATVASEFLASPAPAAPAEAAEPIPLERAHAHNDYLHQRPLYDALAHGFCSIEADVWAADQELLVAHTIVELRHGRTLESLYLKPLAERIVQRDGWVFEPGRTVTLLIDFKTPGQTTYPVLARHLDKYRQLFTPRDPGDGRPAAAPVQAVVSGDRPVELIAADANRLCGVDGRFPDLRAKHDATLIPLISAAWSEEFAWNGAGPMPNAQRARLRRFVAETHDSGRRLRVWGAPDNEAVWSELYDAGVDLLNADDLPRLQKFLLARQK